APVAYGYERSLRPSLALAHHAPSAKRHPEAGVKLAASWAQAAGSDPEASQRQSSWYSRRPRRTKVICSCTSFPWCENESSYARALPPATVTVDEEVVCACRRAASWAATPSSSGTTLGHSAGRNGLSRWKTETE